jgi:hypothetical protein
LAGNLRPHVLNFIPDEFEGWHVPLCERTAYENRKRTELQAAGLWHPPESTPSLVVRALHHSQKGWLNEV